MTIRFITGCDAVHPDRRGGQHVGKPCTGVLAIDDEKGVGVLITNERSQLANKRQAETVLQFLTNPLIVDSQLPARELLNQILDSLTPKFAIHVECIRMGGTGPCACLDGCGACDSCGKWLGDDENEST